MNNNNLFLIKITISIILIVMLGFVYINVYKIGTDNVFEEIETLNQGRESKGAIGVYQNDLCIDFNTFKPKESITKDEKLYYIFDNQKLIKYDTNNIYFSKNIKVYISYELYNNLSFRLEFENDISIICKYNHFFNTLKIYVPAGYSEYSDFVFDLILNYYFDSNPFSLFSNDNIGRIHKRIFDV